MIQVYSENTSNRLKYTLDVIFNYILKVDYKLISEKKIISSASKRRNYKCYSSHSIWIIGGRKNKRARNKSRK